MCPDCEQPTKDPPTGEEASVLAVDENKDGTIEQISLTFAILPTNCWRQSWMGLMLSL
jgi:hypothetical protein